MQKSLAVVIVRLFVLYAAIVINLPSALVEIRDVFFTALRAEMLISLLCWVIALPAVLIYLWRHPACLLPQDDTPEVAVSAEEAAYRVMGVYFIISAVAVFWPVFPSSWQNLATSGFHVNGIIRLVLGIALAFGAKGLRRMFLHLRGRD